MRLHRPFFPIRVLFPDAVFRPAVSGKELFLTFDDGPDPVSTPAILNILGRYNVKAAFFCTGKEALKYPGLMSAIRSEGHLTGNHGYRHLDGWKTNTEVYLRNIREASGYTSASLMRPPYGRIRLRQYRELSAEFTIVFWDLMPYDFDKRLSPAKILEIMKRKVRSGSVIVLHDTNASHAAVILEEFIKSSIDKGFSFSLLPVSLKEQPRIGNQPFK